jgi:penicillin-binding protein 2
MEKYLNDTIQKSSIADVERISNTNKMPTWLTREQYRTDSIRAFEWFKMTKDSTYIHKYVFEESPVPSFPEKQNKDSKKELLAILGTKKYLKKKKDLQEV